MALQQFGTIQGESPSPLILSVDAGKPDEFLFTVLRDEGPFAVVAQATDLASAPLQLSAKSLLRPQANGGLIYPALTFEEQHKLASLHVELFISANGGYEGRWRIGDEWQGTLSLSEPGGLPEVKSITLENWEQFKAWAVESRLELQAALYRGHGSNQFELKTTLHRTGRHRLERYCAETLNTFHGEVEAELGVRFNMNDGADYAVVLALAQHHGLPTPMLDWTTSPYVAAFFAFADALDVKVQ